MANYSTLNQSPTFIYAVSGSAALVTANILLYPIEVITAKLQIQTKRSAKTQSETYYTGFFDAVFKLVKAEGVIGLYAGLLGSLLNNALAGYFFNYWHSFLRRTYISSPKSPKTLGTTTELALAYGAGVLTVLLTNPLANVTTRQKTTPPRERKSIISTAYELVQSDGLKRLWRGLSASFILCINPAITYGSTERLRDFLFGSRQILKPRESFLLGMISKAIAVITLQPISVALATLRSEPPASRDGKAFSSFIEVLLYITKTEGVWRLFKGLGPQLFKAVLMQGILNILKERYKAILTTVYFRYRQ